MKQIKNFRKINEFERSLIFKIFENISSNPSLFLDENVRSLYMSFKTLDPNDKYPSVYFVSAELSEIIDKFKFNDIIMSAGVYFGFVKNNKFFLSLEGAELLYNFQIVNENKYIYVNDEAEKAVLYGNPIKKEMITSVSKELKKEDILLIFNHTNEMISIAQSLVNYNNYQNANPKEIIARNLVDKGYYLRKKQ